MIMDRQQQNAAVRMPADKLLRLQHQLLDWFAKRKRRKGDAGAKSQGHPFLVVVACIR
jgi:hypothetical protein